MPAPVDTSKLEAYLIGELDTAKAQEAIKGIDRTKAHELYMGKKLGKVRPGDPAVVSTDVADAVEAMLPPLLSIFATTDEPVAIKPRRADSRDAARLLTKLIRYQTQRQMPWFKILYTLIKDGLLYRNGDVHWGWEFAFEWIESEYERLTQEDLDKILWDGGELLEPGQVWADDFGRVLGRLDCKVKERKILKDRPFVRPIMPGCLLLSPGAKDIESAAFVAVRDYPRRDDLENQAQAMGYDLAKVSWGKPDSDEEQAARAAERGRDDPLSHGDDLERAQAERHICYYVWPDAKGKMTPHMATVVNGQLIQQGENPYGRATVLSWSPILDTHAHEGISITDKVMEFQYIKTAMYRAMLKSVARQSGNQTIVESGAGLNINDILRNDPDKVLFVNPGKAGAIKDRDFPPLGADAWRLVEWVEGLKEQTTGVTRLNQGLDGSTLNDTARGQMALIEKANERLRLIARLFAELLLKPLFRHLIWMNQNFLDRELVLALTDDEDTTIRPEDLGGEFDLIVNVGLGNSDQAMQVQQGQQLLSILGGLASSPSGQALVTPENLHYILKTIVQAMGWQASLALTDPAKSEEAQLAPGIRGPATGPDGGLQPEDSQGPASQGAFGQPGIPGATGAFSPARAA